MHLRPVSGVQKIRANLSVADAYGTRNKKKLANARKLIAKTIRTVTDFEKSYRKLWYARNKTFGYEVTQIRLAGQAARWREFHLRLKELAG